MSKEIYNIKTTLDIGFRVDTVGLLSEIAAAAMDRKMGVLKIPLNQFVYLLSKLGERATELNDPELNVWMLSLGLYEVPASEIPKAIDYQLSLIHAKPQRVLDVVKLAPSEP